MIENVHWIILALLSALFGAIALILKKKGLEHEHSLEYLGCFKVFEFLIMLPFVYFIELNFPVSIYLMMYLISMFITLALLLNNKGFKRIEFTKSIPLFNLGIIVTFFASMIVLDEILSWKQLTGLGIMMFGLYKVQSQHSLKETLKSFRSKGILLLIIAITIMGIIAVFEKQLLLQTNIYSYLFIMYFFSIINSLIILTIFYDGYHGIIHGIKTEGKLIFGSAFFSTLSNLLFLAAISTAYLVLASIIKKSSNIFTMIVGGKYFHEEGYLKRTLWTIFIIIGVLLVI